MANGFFWSWTWARHGRKNDWTKLEGNQKKIPTFKAQVHNNYIQTFT